MFLLKLSPFRRLLLYCLAFLTVLGVLTIVICRVVVLFPQTVILITCGYGVLVLVILLLFVSLITKEIR